MVRPISKRSFCFKISWWRKLVSPV